MQEVKDKIIKWIYKLFGKQKCKNCIRPVNKVTKHCKPYVRKKCNNALDYFMD